jgi:hypothetical protein
MPPLPTATPSLGDAAAALQSVLGAHLPVPGAPPPPPSTVFPLELSERAVGLGGHRGLDSRAGLTVVELQGVRVEALVRFELWGLSAAAAETAARNLSASLFGDRIGLWAAGVLRIALEGSPAPVEVTAATAWRKDVDYRVLFEHRTESAGEAESLIARIPVHSDPEVRDSLMRETTTVTDELVRWDDLGVTPLVIRGPRDVRSVNVLSFLPAPAPTGAVTLTRTFDGAPAPPSHLGPLATFLELVSGPAPADRNRSFAFASVGDLVAALSPGGSQLELGDWNADGALDLYDAGVLVVDPPISLATSSDRLELAHADTTFDNLGVVYLRFGVVPR